MRVAVKMRFAWIGIKTMEERNVNVRSTSVAMLSEVDDISLVVVVVEVFDCELSVAELKKHISVITFLNKNKKIIA